MEQKYFELKTGGLDDESAAENRHSHFDHIWA